MTKEWTFDTITAQLAGISNNGKWVAFDHEAQEFPELDPDDLTEGGAWWIHGPAFVDYGDYSCFTKADAAFIAAAPDIVRSMMVEIERLQSENERQQKRLDDAELLVDGMGRILTDDQIMEMTDADLTDAYLRWHGYDPEEIIANTQKIIREALEKAQITLGSE